MSDMSVGAVQSEIVKRALALLHGGVSVQDRDEGAKAVTPETVATQVLAEYEPPEADRIVRAWRDITGTHLNPDRVREQLEALRKWEGSWHRG